MIKKYTRTALGIVAGTVLGYVYYQYVGCADGSCPITSQPVNSSIYGAVMGGLFVNLFQK